MSNVTLWRCWCQNVEAAEWAITINKKELGYRFHLTRQEAVQHYLDLLTYEIGQRALEIAWREERLLLTEKLLEEK